MEHTGKAVMKAVRLGILALALCATPLAAQQAGGDANVGVTVEDRDSSLPLEITSNDLRLDQDTNTATFTGDVVAVQGNLTLTADWMEVRYARNSESGANEVSEVTARGNVVMVQEHPDDPDKKPDVAESEVAVYTAETEIVVMTVDVLLVQDGTVLTGDRLDYNVETGEGKMSGRVRTLILPDEPEDPEEPEE
jgi:lipopolysaccharide export system protein LptA